LKLRTPLARSFSLLANSLPSLLHFFFASILHSMNASDFRRIALSFDGAEEGSHAGVADFRVGGRIFATLASQAQGYGNLMLTLEQQAAFVEELPQIFLPIAGGWGRMGMTHIRLAAASKDVLKGALRAAWKLRVEKNAKTGNRSGSKTHAKKKLGSQTTRPPSTKSLHKK
jgi:hypothetical protein